MAFEDSLPQDNSFLVQEYLSESQIEIIRSKSNSGKLADQKECIALIDGFVRSNQKITPEYEKLYGLVQNSLSIMDGLVAYPERIQQGIPALYGIAYYNLLYLVGAFTEEDIAKISEQIRSMMNGETPVDHIGKA